MRCAADDQQALEQLCSTIIRPALANDRVQCNAASQVVRKRKIAWRPGHLGSAASKNRFKRVGRCVPPLLCRIRGSVGQEKGV